ncbi:MAG: class I SAM-dependent methyltransferase [Paludibacter sp.]|nr:class I SAM-dependent methyltransferase [Paludibacter sp.]
MEKQIHISKCPVCSTDNFKKLFICNDFLVSNEKFTLFKCEKCGFVFTQDFPCENAIGKYYDAPEYVSHSNTQRGVVNFLYHFARKIALRSKVKLVQKFAALENGNLLDIGAGTGYFLNSMKNAGWTVSGIEKSVVAQTFAKQKFDLTLYDSEQIMKIADNSKDAITLWHVLEHIENMNDTLRNLYRILKPDGVLIVALPNRISADAHHYRQMWAAYDVPRHLWHFSPSDFNQIAEKHNFKLFKIKTMLFDPIYISILSEKHKSTFVATLVGMIKGVFFTIQSIFNKKNCSSLIYILKKQ